MFFRLCFFCTAVILCLAGCDGGFNPTTLPKTARLYGTVSYSTGWPPLDSLLDIRVMAFQQEPLSIDDIQTSIQNGTAYLTAKSLEKRVSSSSFLLDIPAPPVTLRYIAVAQQFGPNIQRDWRLIGIYANPDKPAEAGAVYVKEGDIIRNINIHVDFASIPKQP